MQIDLNDTVRNDHVIEIERLNRTMKDRIQFVYTDLIQVYNRILEFLVCDLVYAVTFWVNSFPAEYGVSATLNSQAIITGQSVEFSKHWLLDFGEYIHTHKDGDNYMESRTLKALAL